MVCRTTIRKITINFRSRSVSGFAVCVLLSRFSQKWHNNILRKMSSRATGVRVNGKSLKRPLNELTKINTQINIKVIKSQLYWVTRINICRWIRSNETSAHTLRQIQRTHMAYTHNNGVGTQGSRLIVQFMLASLSLSIRPPYLKLWKANSAKCIGVFSALSRNKSTQTMALVRSSNSRKEKQRTPHCSNAEKAIAIVVRNTREKRMRLDRRGQKGERERKEIKTDEIKCFKRLKITLCFFGFFPLFLFYVENHAKISCTSIEIFIYFWRFPFSAPSRCLLM